jgi:hypothetical protein
MWEPLCQQHGVLQLGDRGCRSLRQISLHLPAGFKFLPNGRFLYVCGQEEGYVQCFGVDAATGMLRPVDGAFPAPIPTCIEFYKICRRKARGRGEDIIKAAGFCPLLCRIRGKKTGLSCVITAAVKT